MNPLIILASCPNVEVQSDGSLSRRPEEMAQIVADACQAGASIAELRIIEGYDAIGAPLSRPAVWLETFRRIRDRCDVLLNIGLAAMPIEQRIDMLELKPDMLAFLLGHHDLFRPGGHDLYALRTREEQVRLARACMEQGVKPDFELFTPGNAWNMNHVLEQTGIPGPHWTTLFFAMPGGEWSPDTPEELLNRLRVVPDGSLFCVATHSARQTDLAALAISLGGHVRVGDHQYVTDGVTDSTAQLVARVARLAKELGREVATPSQTRDSLRAGL